MKDYRISEASGFFRPFNVSGRTIRIAEGPGPLEVTPQYGSGDQYTFTMDVGLSVRYPADEAFSGVLFESDKGGEWLVQIGSAELSGTEPPNSYPILETLMPVNVAAGVTALVVPDYPDELGGEVRLFQNSGSVLYVGGSNINNITLGIPLASGADLKLVTTAPIYAYNPTGGAVDVHASILRR